MLSQTHESTRQLFLKNFTAELILNYNEILVKRNAEKSMQESFILQKKQKEIEEEEIRTKLKQIINKTPEKQGIQISPIQVTTQARPLLKTPPIIQKTQNLLEIPEPPRNEDDGASFDSVMPSFLPSGEIDFGKITPLIRDQAVSSVECKRAEDKISIKKLGQTIDTNIKLDEKEINSIIKAFSEKTRIPILEGILKARVNNLEIFAVISQFSTSRFIITKNMPAPQSMNQTGMPNMNRQMMPANPFAPKNPALSFLKK